MEAVVYTQEALVRGATVWTARCQLAFAIFSASYQRELSAATRRRSALRGRTIVRTIASPLVTLQVTRLVTL